MADAAAPAVAPAGPPKTAKRDGLRAMEIEMQAKWTAAKAFEVNAPKVSRLREVILHWHARRSRLSR